MLGAIIGDIAGSRFEFNPTNDYDFELFAPECSYTDDTICTIAIADALLKDRDFGESLHDWCNRYPHPMGGYGGSFAKWVHSDHPQPYNSFGNGAAMRVSPIAWFSLNAIGQSALVEQATACTHNHPEGIKGALAVCTAIHDCLEMHGLYDYIGHKAIMEHGLKRAIEQSGYRIDFAPQEVENKFDETCQGTVPVAFWIISQSHSFEDAIRRAVSLGADADTLGAIVGSIAEAIWGIPEDMKKKALSYLPNEMRAVLQAFRKACPWKISKKIAQEQKHHQEQLQQLQAIMFWKLTWGNPNVAMGLAPKPEEPKRPATANDWNIQPMPIEGVSIRRMRMRLTDDQWHKVQRGHIPHEQEDHWFAYCDTSCLRIYRSWTGTCAYEAYFHKEGREVVIDELVMNHALAQFGVNSEESAFLLFKYLLIAMIDGDAESAWEDYICVWKIIHEKYA